MAAGCSDGNEKRSTGPASYSRGSQSVRTRPRKHYLRTFENGDDGDPGSVVKPHFVHCTSDVRSTAGHTDATMTTILLWESEPATQLPDHNVVVLHLVRDRPCLPLYKPRFHLSPPMTNIPIRNAMKPIALFWGNYYRDGSAFGLTP